MVSVKKNVQKLKNVTLKSTFHTLICNSKLFHLINKSKYIINGNIRNAPKCRE